MQPDKVWAIGILLVFDVNLVYQSGDTMRQLHIRYHIDRTTHTDGQRIAYQSHTIQVGLTQVGTDGGTQFLGVQQSIYTHLTIKQLVVTNY